MGQKVNPIAFRLGTTANWSSRWFDLKHYKENLEQDQAIRSFLQKRLRQAAVERIDIERTAKEVRIAIFTARPGMIIGRGGNAIDQLKADLVRRVFKDVSMKQRVALTIEELRQPDCHARVIGRNIADQLERSVPFRRVMRQALQKAISQTEVEGAKIMVSGRLGGAAMSRTEWIKEGRLPLQTLRANIDYALEEAMTTYGVIGVKVWLYKGDVFEEEEDKSSE